MQADREKVSRANMCYVKHYATTLRRGRLTGGVEQECIQSKSVHSTQLDTRNFAACSILLFEHGNQKKFLNPEMIISSQKHTSEIQKYLPAC